MAKLEDLVKEGVKLIQPAMDKARADLLRKKQPYADKCFGLSVEQIRFFAELTTEQITQVYYHFGNANPNGFVYAVKKDGNLISMRERKRLEWTGYE